jgi:spermidine dehydrogenase
VKSDDELGMGATITRRDLMHDAGLAALGLALGAGGAVTHASGGQSTGTPYYPPTRTGMRGSHPGAFEAAHALAREGREFPAPQDLDEEYDLVIVGAGISGLAAAHYYRERFGADSRILLLENHDDFGGHAKRNEFHQGGTMRLALGGTHNLEWWKFSDTVKTFMATHGVDVDSMRDNMEFGYGANAPNSPAVWFDEERYGANRLVTRCNLRNGAGLNAQNIERFPIDARARRELLRFMERRDDVLEGMDEVQRAQYLGSISYPEFLRRHGELSDAAVQLFDKLNHGAWGVEMRALSAREVLEDGFPGANILGEATEPKPRDYPVAMWPDGNASLARLQVARLMPAVGAATDAGNVARARFDYGQLDRPESPVRLRLNSTVINAENTDGGVNVTYVNGDKVLRVRARHCVMACYHVIVPHLCPKLPDAQKEAMRYQVKVPLHLTNVLLRSTEALDKLGIDSVTCPGRLHGALFTFRGINNGGYTHSMQDKGPVSLVFWGSISPPPEAVDVKAQLRASRAKMLSLDFDDYEREVRTVLDGLLGPAGFDVERDILAITVNRWPHGYAYEYLELWDPHWPEGEAPHEKARQPFGNITIANADASAKAYTHNAIEEAQRAVSELPG